MPSMARLQKFTSKAVRLLTCGPESSADQGVTANRGIQRDRELGADAKGGSTELS